MTTPSKTAPYNGPFPRKRHSHRCQTCKGRQGQRAVACYKQKCTKPQSVEDCIFCRALAKHTPVAVDVCIAGNPAVNGVCGDAECVCAPVAAVCVTDDELAEEFAQLPPEAKTIVAALPPTGTTADPSPAPICEMCAKPWGVCTCGDPDPDDDGGRTQFGDTPTCEDCGESLDDCECGDDPDEDEDDDDLAPAPAGETKQSSLTDEFDREHYDGIRKRRRELAKNPALIKAALPGFLDLLREFDAYMKADDIAGAMLVHDRANDYAADLQGGNFGMLCLDGAAHLLERAAAAPDGELPMWGQRGNFIVRVGLTPIRFEVDGIFGICDPFHFSIHAVKWDKPFPSETGYRSFFQSMAHVPVGATVADWVTDCVNGYIRENCKKGLPMIAFDNRDRHANDPGNSLPVLNAGPQSAPFEPKVIVGRREQKKAAAALPEPPAPPQPEVQTLFGPAFREAVRRKPVAAVEPAAQLSLFGGGL